MVLIKLNSVQTNLQDFNKMDYFFNVIENPFKNHMIFDEVDYNLINSIDLNITNFRKYYPEIREFLKNNEICHEDLYYDFVEIQTMSNYLYDQIEKIMDYKDINDTKNYLEIIVDSLGFISKILKEFHLMLDIKLDYINRKISKEEYDKRYHEYQLKYREDHKEFYTKYYKDKPENTTDIKEIWSLEVI